MAINTDSPAAKYGQKVLAKGKQALEYVKNLEQQRDELVASVENLVRVKGRHHTEQAYKQLEAALAKVKK